MRITVSLILVISFFSFILSKVEINQNYKMPVQHLVLEKFMDKAPKETFKVFYTVYNKNQEYDINSQEGIRRYKIFKDNLKYIKKENSNEENSYRLGLTPFADLTNQEFIDQMLMKQSQVNEIQNFLSAAKQQDEEQDYFDKYADNEDTNINMSKSLTGTKIDWSEYFGWARNQGKCSAGWAFATTGAIEAHRRMVFGGRNVYLSPQQLVDCVGNSNGCRGGNPADALKYIVYTGVIEDSAYPYKNAKRMCNNNLISNNKKVQIKNFVTCGSTCLDQSWYNLLIKGPLIVPVDASSLKFQFYLLGVIYVNPNDCKKVNHFVVATGWDKRVFLSNDEYINARNSWGLLWGEGGNFRIAYRPMSNKTCFMMSDAILPQV